MRRWITRTVSVLLGLALLVTLVCAGALLALTQGWQRDRLRSGVASQLEEALGVPVSLDALAGPLLPSARLLGLRVQAGGATLLALDRLEIDIDVVETLRRRRIWLRRVRAEGLRVSLVETQDGWNFEALRPLRDEPTPESEAAPPPPLSLRAASVRDGRLEVRWLGDEEAPRLAARFEGALRELHLSSGRHWLEPLAATLDVALEPSRLGSGVELRSGALALALEAGDLTLDGGADGAFGHAALDGSVELAPGEPSRLDLRLALRDAEGESLRVRAEGRSDRDLLDGSLEASVPDLARLAAWVPGAEARGELGLRAELSGTPVRPEASLDVAGSALSLRGLDLGALELRADARRDENDWLLTLRALSLRGGALPVHTTRTATLRWGDAGLAVRDLELVSDEQSLAVDGDVSPERFDALRVRARSLDLGAWARLAGAGPALGGRLDVDARLDGKLRSPAAEGSAEWRSPQIAGFAWERLEIESRVSGGALHASARAVEADQEMLRAGLVLPEIRSALAPAEWLARPDTRITLRSDGFDLALLGAILPESLRERLDVKRGLLRADLTLAGATPLPRLEGSLAVEDASMIVPAMDERFDRVRTSLRFAGDRAVVEELRFSARGASGYVAGDLVAQPGAAGATWRDARLRLEDVYLAADEQRLRAGGVVSLHGVEDLHLVANGLELLPLLDLFRLDWDADGVVDADVRIEGPYDALRAVGALEWRQVRLGPTHFDRLEVSAETPDGNLLLSGRLWRGERVLLSADGTLPAMQDTIWRPETWLETEGSRLRVRAESLDLAPLARWLPRTVRDPAGLLDADLELRGGPEGPGLYGRAGLERGALSVPLLARRFEPVDVALRFEGREVRVRRMRVGSQGESAELEGSLRLDGLRVASADLELLLTHFALASSPLLTAKADGRIDVSGPADALSLTGSLSLLDTQVVLPEARDPAYKEIRIIAQSNGRGALTELTETRPQPGFLETASVDVEIVVPSETWVRGRGLNVELAGGVRVRQEPREKPRVSGTVELVRGTYRLQGRVFEVRRGTATFTGASEIDPVIDIEAVHRVSGVRIVALLGGRASDPRLVQLTSEPPMSDNDVVSYLFFGRPASELGQGQSQGVDQVAVKAAAGLAINEFSDLVTQRLPIDTLDIRVGNEGGVTAGVGKYLTRDVFVRYGRGLGRHGEDTTGVEWRLTDELTLESEITSGGAAGADLIWSTDY